MATAELADPPLRVLLITHNVSGIFDSLPAGLSQWICELKALVARLGADFIALHCQEVGGTSWRGSDLASVGTMAQAVEAAFPEYWCSGMMMLADTSVPQEFSALGSMYLVRRKAAARVALWRDAEGERAAQFEPVASLPSPLLSTPALPAARCRHYRFPSSAYPHGPEPSRKGWLRTCWRVGGAPLELINIHNFHDESNLRAIAERADTDATSDYAECRRAHLAKAMAERPSAGVPDVARFIFGDFNFRLDLPSVVRSLCGDAALADARALAPGDDAALALLPRADTPSVSTASGSEGSDATVGAGSIRVGAKAFRFSSAAHLLARVDALRACDGEIPAYNAADPAHPLRELECTFPPTYMYLSGHKGEKRPREESEGGSGDRSGVPAGCPPPGSAEWVDGPALADVVHHVGSKRCPAWCDRVLFDEVGERLVRRSAAPAAYGAQLQHAIVCDHNKVYLSFECG